MADSTLTDNTASYRGAIRAISVNRVVLDRCRLARNAGERGGTISFYLSTNAMGWKPIMDVTRSTIEDNTCIGDAPEATLSVNGAVRTSHPSYPPLLLTPP